ncbi:MAG: hypothetical protein M3P30_03780 [Chloroflexota bacterium]|nr:hypothetical protein [Chloroflexota bacterium]
MCPAVPLVKRYVGDGQSPALPLSSPQGRRCALRQIAEAMERVYGDRVAEYAAELAYQFHRSAGLTGTERGADYALAAADIAEATAAWDETATFLHMALELMPDDDPRRPRVLARTSIASLWALRFEEELLRGPIVHGCPRWANAWQRLAHEPCGSMVVAR